MTSDNRTYRVVWVCCTNQEETLMHTQTVNGHLDVKLRCRLECNDTSVHQGSLLRQRWRADSVRDRHAAGNISIHCIIRWYHQCKALILFYVLFFISFTCSPCFYPFVIVSGSLFYPSIVLFRLKKHLFTLKLSLFVTLPSVN